MKTMLKQILFILADMVMNKEIQLLKVQKKVQNIFLFKKYINFGKKELVNKNILQLFWIVAIRVNGFNKLKMIIISA